MSNNPNDQPGRGGQDQDDSGESGQERREIETTDPARGLGRGRGLEQRAEPNENAAARARRFETIRNSKRAVQERLRDKENVHAVSIGEKEVDGKNTQKPAIIVYVTEKLPKEELQNKDYVPPVIKVGDGNHIPTDVRQADVPSATSASTLRVRHSQHRPVFGGIEVGAAGGSSNGTLSAPVETSDGSVRFLTNRHIAADMDTEPAGGEDIAQPIGDQEGIIGTLTDWSPASDTGVYTSDSALITPASGVEASNHVASVGPLGEPLAASVGDECVISGRSDELGTSRVNSIDYSGLINYDGYYVEFEDVVAFSPTAAEPGDSGSIWGRYNEDAGEIRPVGIHFASGNYDLAIPWGAMEAIHGTLSPLSSGNDASFSTTDTANSTEITPIALTTGDRAVLKCVAARYGDPSDPTDETIQLYNNTTGELLGEESVSAPWGQPEIIEFGGLEELLGVGEHSVHLETAYVGIEAYRITITEPTEHRLYGTITDMDGNELAEATVDVFTQS